MNKTEIAQFLELLKQLDEEKQKELYFMIMGAKIAKTA